MSRAKRDWTIVLTTLLIGLGLLIGLAPEAEAAGDGCKSRIRTQVSKWAHESTYASPKVGAGVHMVGHDVVITASFVYDYCRSTTRGRDAAVKPKFGSMCWTIYGDKGVIYDGVKVEPYLYSNQRIIWNFPKIKVPDKSGKQHCKSIRIPELSRSWHKMRDEPRWNMWSQVVRSGTWDESWENWDSGNATTKRFSPSYDYVLYDWH